MKGNKVEDFISDEDEEKIKKKGMSFLTTLIKIISKAIHSIVAKFLALATGKLKSKKPK